MPTGALYYSGYVIYFKLGSKPRKEIPNQPRGGWKKVRIYVDVPTDVIQSLNRAPHLKAPDHGLPMPYTTMRIGLVDMVFTVYQGVIRFTHKELEGSKRQQTFQP